MQIHLEGSKWKYVPIEVTCVHVQEGCVVSIACRMQYSSEQFHVVHI